MRNQTALGKVVVVALCTLAIALSTIGSGVNPTWAASDEPALSGSTQLSFVPPSAPVKQSPWVQKVMGCTVPPPPGWYTCTCSAAANGTQCGC